MRQQSLKVLEGGCGDGFPTLALKLAFAQNRYTAVDKNTVMIHQIRSRHPWLTALVADVHALPFPADSFDLVLCCEVLEHLQHPAAALAELRRVTASWVVVSVPHEPFFRLGNFLCGKNLSRWDSDPEHRHHFSPRSLVQLLSQSLAVEKTILSFPWIISLASKS